MTEKFYVPWTNVYISGQQLISGDKTYSLSQVKSVTKITDTSGVSLTIPIILTVSGIVALFLAPFPKNLTFFLINIIFAVAVYYLQVLLFQKLFIGISLYTLSGNSEIIAWAEVKKENIAKYEEQIDKIVEKINESLANH